MAKMIIVLAQPLDAGTRADMLQAVAAQLCDLGDVRDCTSSLVVPDADPTLVDGGFAALVEVRTIDGASLGSILDTARAVCDGERLDAYEVDERRIASYAWTWSLGTPTPGDRLVSLVQRRPGLTMHEFADYWHDVHAPVAMSYTVPLWGYTQNVVLRAMDAEAPPADGIAVMHFRGADDRRARYEDHPDEAQRGFVDAAKFMDMAQTRSVLMRETIWKQTEPK